MGGLAPGQLKSRRGSHSSPRRLHIDSASLTGFQDCGENSINFAGLATFSSPSTCGSLALCGPPTWPTLSPPPTSEECVRPQHFDFNRLVEAQRLARTL